MADIKRAAQEALGIIGDIAESIVYDTQRVYHDYFGTFDIIQETSFISPSVEGVVTVRRNVPEFVGAVVLHGGYVGRDGLINRSPSPAHSDTERLVGCRMKLGAEGVLDDEYLLNLVGVPVEEIVEDHVGGRVTLVGAQVNNALSLLLVASEADIAAVAARHGIETSTAESAQKAAAKFVEDAEKVELLTRAGLRRRAPLIAKGRNVDPRLPRHLAERTERTRTTSSSTGGASRIPAHLLARTAEARRRSGLKDE